MSGVEFYFSGSHPEASFTGFVRRSELTPAVLFSYFDVIDRPEVLDTYYDHGVRLMMDSGAYTVATRGLTVDRDAYTRFLDRLWPKLTVAAALDVIGDPAASWENYVWMRERLPVMPVYHVDEPHDLFGAYRALCPPRIGVGGMALDKGRAPGTLDTLHRVFSDIVDGEGRPAVRLHGFAVGYGRALAGFPWASADSATAVRCARGNKLLLDLDGGLEVSIRYGRLYLNERELSEQERRRVLERLAVHGYTLEDVTEYSVLLVAFNVLELRGMAARIPTTYTPRATAATLF